MWGNPTVTIVKKMVHVRLNSELLNLVIEADSIELKGTHFYVFNGDRIVAIFKSEIVDYIHVVG